MFSIARRMYLISAITIRMYCIRLEYTEQRKSNVLCSVHSWTDKRIVISMVRFQRAPIGCCADCGVYWNSKPKASLQLNNELNATGWEEKCSHLLERRIEWLWNLLEISWILNYTHIISDLLISIVINSKTFRIISLSGKLEFFQFCTGPRVEEKWISRRI